MSVADGLAVGLPDDPGSTDVTILLPGVRTAFEPARWRGCLVMVQSGALHLTCRSGSEAVFASGSVLYLEGLPLQSIAADGSTRAVLLAVRKPERR